MRKIDLIFDLYDKTLKRAVSSSEEWKAFLRTACKNYKFGFDAQLLVYAQKPDATAVLEIEKWNRLFGRWVNKGASSIAVPSGSVSMHRDQKIIRYFDISDTHEGRYSRSVPLWKFKPEYTDAVIDTLENTFGELKDKSTLIKAVRSAAEIAVQDNLTDYLGEFTELAAEDMYLKKDYDNEAIQALSAGFVTNSVIYIILSRLELDGETEFPDDEFRFIRKLRRNQLSTLGSAITDIAKMGLVEIAKTVSEIEKETLANTSNIQYNHINNKSERRINQNEQDNSRGTGRNVSPGGELSRTGFESPAAERGGTGDTSRNTGKPAPQVHQGISSQLLSGADDERNAQAVSSRGGGKSYGDGGIPDKTDGGENGRERGTESERPDEMGRAYEQHPGVGGGSGKRDGYLHNLLNTDEEKQNTEAVGAEEIPSAFSMSVPDEAVDTVLRLGGNDKEGRMKIAAEFSKGKANVDNAEFLRKLFHGGSGIVIEKGRYSAWFTENGILIAPGDSARYSNGAKLISWNEAAKRADKLLNEGNFAANVEIAEAGNLERRNAAEALWYLKHDLSDEAKEKGYLVCLNEYEGGVFPDEVDRLAEALKQPENSQRIASSLGALYADYHYNEQKSLLRFHFHKLNDMLVSLAEMPMPRKEYKSNFAEVPKVKQFITEDEIAVVLAIRSSGVTGCKHRIYSFFTKNHTLQEQITFLKSEYGTGSAYPAVYNLDEDHSAKGIRILKRECPGVQLSWNNAAKRIIELIQKDRFLSPKEKEQFDRFYLDNPQTTEEASLPDDDEENNEEYEAGDEESKSDDAEKVRENTEKAAAAGQAISEETKENGAKEEAKEKPQPEGRSHFFPKYNEIKAQRPDDIVLFQLGDFFEMFGEDAMKAAEILDLQLTTRDIPNVGRVPMCGVPGHTLEKMLEKLREHYGVTISAVPEGSSERGVYSMPIYAPHKKKEPPEAAETSGNAADAFKADYALLDRLTADCKYFLGNGLRNEKHLWAGNVRAQIAKMRELYDKVPKKPEYFEEKSIEQYEREMLAEAEYVYNPGDSAYIQGKEYQIIAFDDDTVHLADPLFPLFSREIPRQEFDRQIKAHPYNNHLIVLKFPDEVKTGQSASSKNEDAFFNTEEKAAENDAAVISLGNESPAKKEIADVNSDKASDKLTDLQRKANEIAEKYENLSMQDQITVIARSFGCPSGHIETSPCRGKWRGTSDISIRLDNGLLLFLGNAATPQAKTIKAQHNLVRDALTRYNPEIIVLSKATAFKALRKREAKDNEIAKQRGLKPYTLLNIEFNDGTDAESSGYMGWYYVTLAVDGKIRAHLETGLHYGIASGTTADVPSKADYYPAGGLDESDVDYVFNGVGFSSSSEMYSLKAGEAVIERAKATLAVRNGSAQPEPISNDFVPDNPAAETNAVPAQPAAEPEIPEISEIPEVQEQPKNDENHIYRYIANKMRSYDIHPEIPMSERSNFDLSENPIEEVGKKERFRRNMAAINVLKSCNSENRFATPEEQLVLSKYVGWGGLSEAFDETNSSWSNEFAELQNALSGEEYESARESTLTAFFTPPEVIQAIYKGLENLGFKNGKILEPSCGIGHFIGMLPEKMKDSQITAVEIDKISANIAQQLYQKASVAALPFERTALPDNYFDVAIGNVPFGDFKINDRHYNKYKFLIHDYFFAKALDKVRPGGIVAFITSKGTLDKESEYVRRYIAQYAEFLGAVRLPNNVFKRNAGTDVVSDIIFLQKRERLQSLDEDNTPEWIKSAYTWIKSTNVRGVVNNYFYVHPEMVLGNFADVSGRFGRELTVNPFPDSDLAQLLEKAISNIKGEIKPYEREAPEEEPEEENSIPADPDVRNFSYTVVNDDVYFRENARMAPEFLSVTAKNRVKGMILIRDTLRHLIELERDNHSDDEIAAGQKELNELYDNFTKKYGLLSSRANVSVFSRDSSMPLLLSLETVDENGKLIRKGDMFTKRTIRPHIPVTSVDTASEAFAVSMSERACVDMGYMCSLCKKSEEEIYDDLKGVIFLNPAYDKDTVNEKKYLPADEYLSGNVREKLAEAKIAQKLHSAYTVNVEALEKAQPKDLTAAEISIRLGASWVPEDIVEQFVYEFLDTPLYAQYKIHAQHSKITEVWNIEGKSYDSYNIKAVNTYGTNRMNAYKIIEETLNLRDVRIYDYVEDADGKKKAILNKTETEVAQSKQELIKQGFKDWVWQDPQRRDRLCKIYNKCFNSVRPREYDGKHIGFVGINPEINLYEHQRNAIARVLYGGNSLLAHVVGAGKTYEMVAAAMEAKRLGLCTKSMFVVPNHLTEQWGAEFLKLYPAANILVVTKRDFEPKNRKKICARIATGEYDAVIIGHSQLEKIPISTERQRRIILDQIREIRESIAEDKWKRGERFTVKQMERLKKSLELKLERLNDQNPKDNVVTFEELGVDRLFIDESHNFKNLMLVSKMRNVAGVAQTDAKKSSDLFMKCRYMDELTGGKGIVFATGTPVSNSMSELYTIQRYLQYDTLNERGLQSFDAWASTFGETTTAIELAPEGTGYRTRTRFSRFYNLPELMKMFGEIADIKTQDMLNLPLPKANHHNIVVKLSEIQKEFIGTLAERAEKIHNGSVKSNVDNMLKVTSEGRKAALDQRLINPLLPDFEGSKVNACVDNVYRIWKETAENKSTQLIFCDLSTPKADGSFSVYTDIRDKLIGLGIPENEIWFVHSAGTEAKKAELFKKVRSGDVRILLGSTQKMGTGTNVQNRLIAAHDLDCPWRPSDLEQRSGRIIRQGNENSEAEIYRYVTEDTFDAYLYQTVEGKQRFISQIMTGKSPVRAAEDVDAASLSYAEIKALAVGDPRIKEKMELDISVKKLTAVKTAFLKDKYALEDRILKGFPAEISTRKDRIAGLEADAETVKAHPKLINGEFAGMKVGKAYFTEKADAGAAILKFCGQLKNGGTYASLGEYRGFKMKLSFDILSREFELSFKGALTHTINLGNDVFGNITRMDNALDGIPQALEKAKQQLQNTYTQLEIAKTDVLRPFPQEDELKRVQTRLAELNAALSLDKRTNEIADDEQCEETETADEPFEKQKCKNRSDAR